MKSEINKQKPNMQILLVILAIYAYWAFTRMRKMSEHISVLTHGLLKAKNNEKMLLARIDVLKLNLQEASTPPSTHSKKAPPPKKPIKKPEPYQPGKGKYAGSMFFGSE